MTTLTTPDHQPRMEPSKARRATLVIGAVVVLVAALIGGGVAWSTKQRQDRQNLVAERGAGVMPFDLDATTHKFLPTETGGVQTVVADNPNDGEQVKLIRGHLKAEAAAFQRGEFTDPARIHGEDMPGLKTLRAGASSIAITYADLPDGAQLTYRTADATLVDALHDWFAAQTADHGTHAQ